MTTRFDLSVIIPTYNEEVHLPRLLPQLWQQNGIKLQVIVIDGGSRDSTSQILQHEFVLHSSDLLWCSTPAHRAKQLNLGATLADADYILFLHADTQLDNSPHQLQQALLHLKNNNVRTEGAGHFPLYFNDTQGRHKYGFYFYAAKTALNRADVINGDQGFLLSRRLFLQMGCFDESLPYMEDARLANKILGIHGWMTLPGCVYTSARRFLSEGFEKRQLLNSFLCNFNNIGLTEFFTLAANAYRQQNHAQTLDMLPFLRIIHQVLRAAGWRKSAKYWYLTGRYIVNNAWQLAFERDCRRAYRNKISAHQVAPRLLAAFDRRIAPWLCSAPFYAICSLLSLIWFYFLFLVYRR